ncbi:MAG: hypothetical protein HYR55_15815 [Acidobacteria bacterium]|nr:hypothetical protein [Acidobacteriota bacterium]MBI3656814.1 hypothetical protein [Acidobacteriota bacterium]
MKQEKGKRSRIPEFARKAEKALKEAVAEVVREHQASGQPLAVWKDGRAVWLSADTLLEKAPIKHGKKKG